MTGVGDGPLLWTARILWRDLPSSRTLGKTLPTLLHFIPSTVLKLAYNAPRHRRKYIQIQLTWSKAILVNSYLHMFLFVCVLTITQWVLCALPFRCRSYPCFAYGETRLRDWWPAQHHNHWLWVWTQVCLIPSPVLLNKSLYIFNSFNSKCIKGQLSCLSCLLAHNHLFLEKILPFLEFSFRVNSKHINCIGEYITFFTFSVFFFVLCFFYLTMDLEIFSQSIYRHFLFFYSCSLRQFTPRASVNPKDIWQTQGGSWLGCEWWRQATDLSINNNIKHLLCLYSGGNCG